MRDTNYAPALERQASRDSAGGTTGTRLYYGAEDGTPVALDLSADPHVLVIGKDADERTSVMQRLLVEAVKHGFECHVADPTSGGANFTFAEPWLCSMSGDLHEISAMVSAAYEEHYRRAGLLADYEVERIEFLPEAVRPRHMLLMIDGIDPLLPTAARSPIASRNELLEALAGDDARWREPAARDAIGAALSGLAGERDTGIHLALSTASLDGWPADSGIDLAMIRSIPQHITPGPIPGFGFLNTSAAGQPRQVEHWPEAEASSDAHDLARITFEGREPVPEHERLDLAELSDAECREARWLLMLAKASVMSEAPRLWLPKLVAEDEPISVPMSTDGRWATVHGATFQVQRHVPVSKYFTERFVEALTETLTAREGTPVQAWVETLADGSGSESEFTVRWMEVG